MNRRQEQRLRATALLLLTGVLVALAARPFRTQHAVEVLYPSTSLSEVRHLSDYNQHLTGTAGDTEVYVFEGDEPGGALLIAGGTHANELAGVMTAVLLVETLAVRTGRVFVIPHANASAATATRPREADPAFIELTTPTGVRHFRYGSRFTNPVHQRPDPPSFRHPASPMTRQGCEARNLNRVYPGVQDGTLTERVAWAITELIRQEDIALAFDLHEAPPERRLVNAIVATETSLDLAAEAVLALQMDGWDFHLEASSPAFHGFSHREWTDATATRPILIESANPAQGRWRDRTTTDLPLTGNDANYRRLAAAGRLPMPYDLGGIPIERRVARHLAGLSAILAVYNADPATAPIGIGGWPSAAELESDGLGKCVPIQHR